MTIQFIGGPVDGQIIESKFDAGRVIIPLMTEGGFGQFVYHEEPEQVPRRYANSPVRFVPE